MIAIYLTYRAAANGLSLYSYGSSLSQYMVLNISTTHPADKVSDPVSHFQFTRAGCNISRIPNISKRDLSLNGHYSFEISFPSTITTDGMVLVLHESFQCESISFRVAGSSDLGWRTVGSSTYRKRRSGIHFASGYVPCKRTLVFDYRGKWPLMVVGAVEPTFQAVLCLAFSLSGLLQWEGVGATFIFLTLLTLASIAIIGAVGYIKVGEASEAVLPFAFAATYLALAASFSSAPSILIDTVSATACTLILVRVIIDCAVLGDPSNLPADFPALNLLLALTSSAALLARRRFIARAVRDALADRAVHDSAWLSFVAGEDPIQLKNDLARLAAIVQRVRRSCCAERPRQLQRPIGSEIGGDVSNGQERSSDLGFSRLGSNERQFGFFRRTSSAGISAAGSDVSGWDKLAGPRSVFWPCCCSDCEATVSRPVACLDQLYSQVLIRTHMA